jgi:hypothetical protein
MRVHQREQAMSDTAAQIHTADFGHIDGDLLKALERWLNLRTARHLMNEEGQFTMDRAAVFWAKSGNFLLSSSFDGWYEPSKEGVIKTLKQLRRHLFECDVDLES